MRIILITKISYARNKISYTMLTYCLKCKKDTDNVNLMVIQRKNGRTMLLSKCAICGNKKSRFKKNKKQND